MSAHEVELDDQIRHRFTVLTWAVGIAAALTVATLGMVVTMSYQLGHIQTARRPARPRAGISWAHWRFR